MSLRAVPISPLAPVIKTLTSIASVFADVYVRYGLFEAAIGCRSSGQSSATLGIGRGGEIDLLDEGAHLTRIDRIGGLVPSA